jgi:hypothetical protein
MGLLDGVAEWSLGTTARLRRTGFDYEARQTEVLRRCPVCGEAPLRPFGRGDRYGLPVKSDYCGTCATVFLNPRMTPAEYAQFYASGTYRQLLSAVRSSHKHRESGGADRLPARISALVEHLPAHVPSGSPLRVLDIGGTRRVFERLCDVIPLADYVCVNPAPQEIDVCGEGGFRVVAANFEDYEARGEEFDVVILLGTISHLLEPGNAFLKIGSLLAAEGVFAFDLSDVTCKMLSLGHPRLALQVDHPVYPSPAGVAQMLVSAGLTVIRRIEPNARVSVYFAGKGRCDRSSAGPAANLSALEVLAARMADPLPWRYVAARLRDRLLGMLGACR